MARGPGARVEFGNRISVALALCAAAWLTAAAGPGTSGRRSASDRSSLALMAGRSLAAGPASAGPRAEAALPDALGKARYLGAIGWSVAECAVYAGLAIGAVADHWSAIWILAIAVLSLTGVREVMTASMWPAGRDDPDRSLLRRVIAEACGCRRRASRPIIIVAPVWGSRAALLALLDWTIIAVGFGLASLQGPAREDRGAAAADPAPAPPREPQGLSVLLLPAAAPAEPRLDPADVDALEVPGDDASQIPARDRKLPVPGRGERTAASCSSGPGQPACGGQPAAGGP